MPMSGSPGGEVVVTINRAALHHTIAEPGGITGRYLLMKMLAVRNTAVLLCSVRTGRLRSSIQTDGPHSIGSSDMYGTVGTDVEYAYWVHEGRGAIVAPPGRVLRWVAPDGTVVFSRRSGPAKAQPFLRKAMEAHGVR